MAPDKIHTRLHRRSIQHFLKGNSTEEVKQMGHSLGKISCDGSMNRESISVGCDVTIPPEKARRQI